MATALREAEPPRQLCLDVERPILTRPRRPRATPSEPAARAPDRQMELRMVPPPVPVVPIPKIASRSLAKLAGATTIQAAPAPNGRLPFGAWLLDQSRRPGLIGELAKAVKLDRLFPKRGTVDEVRARFAAVGADGDAFMALDDAETEYDRL